MAEERAHGAETQLAVDLGQGQAVGKRVWAHHVVCIIVRRSANSSGGRGCGALNIEGRDPLG